MECVKGKVRIKFVELGEGWNGEYNPDDPNDEELERFDIDVFEEGEWWTLPDGSYCTGMPVSASDAVKQAALDLMMDKLYDLVLKDNYKRMAEELSWVTPEWVAKRLEGK